MRSNGEDRGIKNRFTCHLFYPYPLEQSFNKSTFDFWLQLFGALGAKLCKKRHNRDFHKIFTRKLCNSDKCRDFYWIASEFKFHYSDVCCVVSSIYGIISEY